MKKNSILLAGFFILLLAPLSAETSSFSFSSDTTRAVLAKGKERTILSGNAFIHSENTEIKADSIELYGEDFRYASCAGKVTAFNREKGIIMTCENLFYDREEERMIITGYGEMQDQKNELVVKGGFFEDNGNENITIIEIGVKILKIAEGKEMVCRAEYARYERDKDILILSGMPEVYWKDDHYSAARITINLETDEITLEGKVSGSVSTQEQSEDNE
ncbi:MAG: hypothetical protein JW760_06895 [Spirochaetales bacterium]|nr:hypothetical protein [Spirochaetales bacterium]